MHPVHLGLVRRKQLLLHNLDPADVVAAFPELEVHETTEQNTWAGSSWIHVKDVRLGVEFNGEVLARRVTGPANQSQTRS